MISKSLEEYLKTMYILKKQNGKEYSFFLNFNRIKKILVTEDILFPEKKKWGFRDNHAGKTIRKKYYDCKDLLEANSLYDITSKKTENKRVFAVNFQGCASSVGKIRLGMNKKGRVVTTGEYVSLDEIKTQVLTSLNWKENLFLFDKEQDQFIDKDTFLKRIEKLKNESCSLLLKHGEDSKESSTYLSLKSSNSSIYERNDELRFSIYTPEMDYGEYIVQDVLKSFLENYTIFELEPIHKTSFSSSGIFPIT